MNIDNGEIRSLGSLTKADLEAKLGEAKLWEPISRAERRALHPLPPAERPAALAAHRDSRAKRRKQAAASRRRNR
jgi:hypothetical protein